MPAATQIGKTHYGEPIRVFRILPGESRVTQWIVVGSTQSGKPVFSNSDYDRDEYADFTEADYRDALEIHTAIHTYHNTQRQRLNAALKREDLTRAQRGILEDEKALHNFARSRQLSILNFLQQKLQKD